MNKAIKVLLVEDSDDDAMLAIRMLRREGFEVQYRRVESAAAMQAALQGEPWDAVISDFHLPGFTGLDALGIFKASGLDIPYILVSGGLGEETAVQAMKAGASDYVAKQHLMRLAPALERELREAANRSAHRQAQRDLAESEKEGKRYVIGLENALMSTVGVATTLSEMRDPYTAGHERRVAAIAAAIGAELGFDARRQEGLRVAGHLHDMGKISLPSEILSKPGKLSRTEIELIKGHAQASYEVLKGVEFPWPVAEVALQHHERLDGSGYPQGLRGDAILIEARIMAVADVVEAMSSHWPYRPGLDIERALAEIERGRGTAHEPAVVDACLTLFREKAYAIPD